MKYSYKTPHDAIISLENAYTNMDDDAIINSKNFNAEAKLLLKHASYNYDLDNNELIAETAEVLKLSLIQNLKENGYPNFNSVVRDFSEVIFKDDLYIVIETLIYPDNFKYENKIYLTHKDNIWKVALVEE